MDIEHVRCEDCLYWANVKPAAGGRDMSGECRRYPPAPVALPRDGKMVTRFPLVFDHWSCGEFSMLPE